MKKQTIGLMVLLFIGTIALYSITATYGLINLDDYQYTVSNKPVATGLTASGITWALSNVEFGIWMPLTWWSYMLDFTLFDGAPCALHMHNIVLHACNSVILFCLLELVFLHKREVSADLEGPGAWSRIGVAVAVAFWAWHPLRVEPVVWVASRKDVLFTFWYLLALLLWIYRLQSQATTKREALKIMTACCFGLSCMSKPSAMTFPIVAALLEWGMTRSVRWRDYFYIGGGALCAAILAQYAQSVAGAKEVLGTVPLYGRLLNASAALGIYCWKTMWPSDLAIQCLNRWPALPRFWWQGICVCVVYGALLFVLGLRVTIWKTFRKAPAGDFGGGTPTLHTCTDTRMVCGLGLFLIAVGPTLGLSVFGYHAYADRFTYLPTIGWSFLLAGSLVMAGRKIVLSTVSVVILLGALSWHQLQYWRNEETLFKHTLAVDGEQNPMAHGALALYYYEQEYGSSKALEHFDKAYHYFGNKPFDFMILQYVEVLAMAGKGARAREEIRAYMERERKQFTKAVEEMGGPIHTTGLSHVLYACVNMYEGDYTLAAEQLERGAKFQPELIEIQYLRGRLAKLQGRKAEADYYWEKCIDNRSSYVKYRFLKGKETQK